MPNRVESVTQRQRCYADTSIFAQVDKNVAECDFCVVRNAMCGFHPSSVVRLHAL